MHEITTAETPLLMENKKLKYGAILIRMRSGIIASQKRR